MNDDEVKQEKKEDEEEEICTCGHYLSRQQQQQQQQQQQHDELGAVLSNNSKGPSSTAKSAAAAAAHLETSFVHLPALMMQYPPHFTILDNNNNTNDSPEGHYNHNNSKNNNNFWQMHQHLDELIRASQTGGDGAQICSPCIHRVERALEADSERLEHECFMYQQAARKEEERLERLDKALQSVSHRGASTYDDDDDDESDDDNPHITTKNNSLQAAEQAFRDEIWALEEDCRQQEAELLNYQALRQEQLELAEDLAAAEYELEVQRNALELESRAFNNDQDQLFQSLADIQTEVDKLSSNISLPSILLDLQVDKERGLRYPLINELRLAYRPKGDIKWNEIQVAWSLAAQLLLVVGTLFHYPSEQWKIVPLSHCAKLIFFNKNSTDATASTEEQQQQQIDAARKGAIVYHLGHPKTNGAKALKAWNTLLHQVILHVNQTHEQEQNVLQGATPFPKLPYPISAHTIGNLNLNELNEHDDAGWSRAIHCMASNLLWLSDCASLYTSQQVMWTSAVLQTCIS